MRQRGDSQRSTHRPPSVGSGVATTEYRLARRGGMMLAPHEPSLPGSLVPLAWPGITALKSAGLAPVIDEWCPIEGVRIGMPCVRRLTPCGKRVVR
jgi:hypothetical protein